MHPSMKHVSTVRRSLGIPTIFNLLGPLCNPASAPFQLLGVGRPELRPRLSAALRLLGTRRAAVVNGSDGLDEVTLHGSTYVTLIEGETISETTWSPHQFGLPQSTLEKLLVEGPAASAALIHDILSGTPGPARDIVVVNSAAALWLTRRATDVVEGAALAAEAIDRGAARRLLQRLAEVSRSS